MKKKLANPCPLCEGKSPETLWTGVNGVSLLFCQDCGHVYTEAPAACVFSHDNFQQAYPEEHLLDPHNEQYQYAEKRAELLLSRKADLNVVVEVGSAYGHFLASLPPTVKVVGVEPSAPEADFAQRHFAFPIIRKELQDAEAFLPMGSVDALCSFHVLEHFESPKDFFSFAQRCLKVQGALYLSVPDIATVHPDLIELLFVSNCWHKHYFSEETLQRLFYEHGFSADVFPEPSTPMYPSSVACIGERISCAGPGMEVRDVEMRRSEGRLFAAGLSSLCEHLREAFAVWRDAGKNVCIWGAGLHTQSLLRFTSIDLSSLSYLVDDDPLKCGNTLEGIDIKSREQLKGSAPDIILISSLASEDTLLRTVPELFPKSTCLGIYADIAKGIYGPHK